MKRSTYTAVILISASLVIQSCNHNSSTKIATEKYKIDTGSVKFLKTAIEGGLTEIKASELAASHSQNERVTSLAKMVVDDHTKADEKLKKIETSNALAGTDAVSAAHNQSIDDLAKKSGANFDKAYIQAMIKDHEGAVLMFINATQAKDSTVRIFAKKTLPVIQMHLDSARKISKDLK